MKEWFQKQRPQAVLGLAFDGTHVEAVVVRRDGHAAGIAQTAAGTFSADPAKADPVVLGVELKAMLDAAEIRERRCVVALPASWVLSLQSMLPELSDEDTRGLLQLEAENGFPFPPEALGIAVSRSQAAGGPVYATQLAVPLEQIAKVGSMLRAARLTPVSFTLGIAASQLPGKTGGSGGGVVALFVGARDVALLAVAGGGIAALRTLEPAVQGEGAEAQVPADRVGRELRVTTGQLPPTLRDSLRGLRIFGTGAAADRLAAELAPRAEALGLEVERVVAFAPGELGLKVPVSAPVGAAMAVATRYLAGTATGLEFLPPQVSAWQQFAGKHSSGKLMLAAKVGGAVVAAVSLAFIVQQVRLTMLRSEWSGMAPKVRELETLQQQIKRYRPWFDDSVRSLGILRRMTEAFPENGDVTAKTIEIRESGQVICSATAKDRVAMNRTLAKLRATPDIAELQLEQSPGEAPVQFNFNFRWAAGPSRP